ncbi:uncharacterized protein NECHADRAFT_76022 [Fusarium vanettenii 77-13-4]|uniref:CFEM domain-containing protein n=1 Tax=Fusarium vanettenii (strain ATCC MYA-4622 / CBS 123669 / FGSC 9596 / NRRL 45880 / 77-13-4) TaxID=660122 RepID=C7Z693_FUSV7|nr:uncharacterized protein NECHADRAFT_76022 [Fusarium vanettenii 77-13-4]EEU40658.1 predicted protein [Fusarium vanettenii 77-13-4]
MKPITSTSLLFLLGLASSLAQDTTQPSPDTVSLTSASGAASTTGISPEIEKNRAECFQDCYRKYGSFPSCSLGKDKFFECWCGEDDWVEREEDCVWDVCGVDAYNSYGDIQRSLCAKVETPSGKASKTATLTSTEEQPTQTSAGSETTSSASTQTDSSTSETGSSSTSRTVSSNSSTATQEETSQATQEPNGSVAGLTSGAKAGLVVGVTYLVLMIL